MFLIPASFSNWLNFLCTELYNYLTSTPLPASVTISHSFNPSTVKVIISWYSSTGCTCYLHRCISYFDSPAGSEVNIQHMSMLRCIAEAVSSGSLPVIFKVLILNDTICIMHLHVSNFVLAWALHLTPGQRPDWRDVLCLVCSVPLAHYTRVENSAVIYFSDAHAPRGCSSFQHRTYGIPLSFVYLET